MNFLSVKGPALMSKYVGESERGVREMFKTARQAAPCIIFLDETEALLPARGMGSSDSHVSERVLSQFLAELDGIEELKGVLVLGATNRLDMMDPAVLRPGRFDDIVEIPLADEADRREIFAVHLRGKPLAKGISVKQVGGPDRRFKRRRNRRESATKRPWRRCAGPWRRKWPNRAPERPMCASCQATWKSRSRRCWGGGED